MRAVERIRTCICFCTCVLLAGVAAAQNPPRSATYISAKDIQRSLAPAPPSGVRDSVLRVLPVAGQYNVGVAAVRRVRVNGKNPTGAVEHHDVTEVYEIVKGSGTLVTGGELIDPKEITNPVIVGEIGPSAQGRGIRNGTSRHVSVGDVVVIPAGVPHGFSEVSPEGVSYILVRIDTHRVLKLR